MPVLTGKVQAFWGRLWGEETAWGALGVLGTDPPRRGPAQEPLRAGSDPSLREYSGAHALIWGVSQVYRAGLPHPLSLPVPPALPRGCSRCGGTPGLREHPRMGSACADPHIATGWEPQNHHAHKRNSGVQSATANPPQPFHCPWPPSEGQEEMAFLCIISVFPSFFFPTNIGHQRN